MYNFIYLGFLKLKLKFCIVKCFCLIGLLVFIELKFIECLNGSIF